MIAYLIRTIIGLCLFLIQLAIRLIQRIISDIIFVSVYLYNVFKYQEKPMQRIWDDIKQYKMKQFIIACICLFVGLFIGVQHYTDIPSIDTPYSKVGELRMALNDKIYIVTNKILFYADKEDKWLNDHSSIVNVHNTIFFSKRHKRDRRHRRLLRLKLIEERLNREIVQ